MNFEDVVLLKKLGGSGGGSSAPADWNAKEGEAGYVKNRTHWEEEGLVTLVDNQTYEFDTSNYNDGGNTAWCDVEFTGEFIPELGNAVTVVWDGVTYDNLVVQGDETLRWFSAYEDGADVDADNYLFYIEFYADFPQWRLYADTYSPETSHTITVISEGTVVHHLDPKYIKDMYYDSTAEVVTGSIENANFNVFLNGDPHAKFDNSNSSLLEFMSDYSVKSAYPFADLTIDGETVRIKNGSNGYVDAMRTTQTDNSGRVMTVSRLSIYSDSFGVSVRCFGGEIQENYSDGCFLYVWGIDHNDITDISFTVYDGEIKKIDQKYLPSVGWFYCFNGDNKETIYKDTELSVPVLEADVDEAMSVGTVRILSVESGSWYIPSCLQHGVTGYTLFCGTRASGGVTFYTDDYDGGAE